MIGGRRVNHENQSSRSKQLTLDVKNREGKRFGQKLLDNFYFLTP